MATIPLNPDALHGAYANPLTIKARCDAPEGFDWDAPRERVYVYPYNADTPTLTLSGLTLPDQ